MTVIIMIINIITISLSSTTATKIVKIRWNDVSSESYDNHSIYDNIVLMILQF